MSKKTETKETVKYDKQQIIKSKKYSKYKDILVAILENDKNYSIDEIDRKIENFLKRKV